MSDKKPKGKPNRVMKVVTGVIILCVIAGAVIFASLLFFPLLFILLLGLPLWVWVRNWNRGEHRSADRKKQTMVGKSRYTVLEDEPDSGSDRETHQTEDKK